MAQFIAYDEGVEVRGDSISVFIHALDAGKETRIAMLKKHGIQHLEAGKWYKQHSVLSVHREISETLGDKTLFAIGKAVIDHAKFPAEITDLKNGLSLLDAGYQMNHRGGKIGHYKLTEFDEKKRQAVMVCDNPYPSEFDRGIITSILRRFKPKDSFKYDVVLDLKKESRLKGADSCTYSIVW